MNSAKGKYFPLKIYYSHWSIQSYMKCWMKRAKNVKKRKKNIKLKCKKVFGISEVRCDSLNVKSILWNSSKTMANTSSSIEVQIDNFLEHFKRSASKAMDTDWITTTSSSIDQSPNNITTTMTAASFNHSSPLKTTKTRSSCFDISQLSGSITGTRN